MEFNDRAHPKTLVLFDVDGTLTPARKVSYPHGLLVDYSIPSGSFFLLQKWNKQIELFLWIAKGNTYVHQRIRNEDIEIYMYIYTQVYNYNYKLKHNTTYTDDPNVKFETD